MFSIFNAFPFLIYMHGNVFFRNYFCLQQKKGVKRDSELKYARGQNQPASFGAWANHSQLRMVVELLTVFDAVMQSKYYARRPRWECRGLRLLTP